MNAGDIPPTLHYHPHPVLGGEEGYPCSGWGGGGILTWSEYHPFPPLPGTENITFHHPLDVAAKFLLKKFHLNLHQAKSDVISFLVVMLVGVQGQKIKVAQNCPKQILVLEFLKSNEIFKIS